MRFLPAWPLAAALLAAPAAAQTLDGAAAFDTAWSAIHRTHFDTTFNGVDWPAVRDELRPRAAVAADAGELRVVLREMLGRLRQSHFYLIPGESEGELSSGGAAGDGDAGLDVRLLDGALVVTAVRPGGPAERAGIRPGWVVERVGTRDGERLLSALGSLEDPRLRELQAWSSLRAAQTGAAGDTLPVRLRDGEERVQEMGLVLDTPPGQVTRFGNLPPMRVAVHSERLDAGGRSVGLIRFNLWLPALAARLDDAVHRLRDADAIVLDLRGNVGGAGAMAMGVAGHFIDRADTLGTMRMRTATLQFVVNPRRATAEGERVRPFAGPVAILTDATTASTSEIFAAGLQGLGRARVFGAATAGQALPAWMRRLPGGDVLVHAVADYTGPAGKRPEGGGVQPDVAAPPTRAALLAGRDPALDAALAWIAGETP